MHQVETNGIDRCNILGVNVSATFMEQAVETMERWIQEGSKQYVCVTSVHGVIESRFDSNLRQIHNRAGMVVPDGVPLVWFMRAEGHSQVSQVSQVYGPDLMLAMLQKAQIKHFFYGSSDNALKQLKATLEKRYTGINIVGMHSPPFRPLTNEESETIVSDINQCNPDIVWVGLSTPKQEKWISQHRERLSAAVIVGVGAAFDFHADITPQAPLFFRKRGLEWLYRLSVEPGRLWKRYVKIVPLFIFFGLAQKLGIKRLSDI